MVLHPDNFSANAGIINPNIINTTLTIPQDDNSNEQFLR